MVGMLVLNAVDHRFNPWPCQTKTMKLILTPVIMQHKSLNSDGQQKEQSPLKIKSGFMLTSILIPVRVQSMLRERVLNQAVNQGIKKKVLDLIVINLYPVFKGIKVIEITIYFPT